MGGRHGNVLAARWTFSDGSSAAGTSVAAPAGRRAHSDDRRRCRQHGFDHGLPRLAGSAGAPAGLDRPARLIYAVACAAPLLLDAAFRVVSTS
jgi:hypothetical protein